MNFNYLPSLFHMASVKIVSHLFQDCEIKNMLDDDLTMLHPFHFNQDHRLELWEFIEEIAEEKLSFLPPSVLKKAVNIMQPMHYQIVMWMEDHVFIYTESTDFCISCTNFLCWKTDGTINREQTAKNIVRSEIIDIIDRFELACSYLLTDEILSLWDRIEEVDIVNLPESHANTAVRFWITLLQKGISRPLNELIEEYFRPSLEIHTDIKWRLSSYFRFLSHDCRVDYLDDEYRIHRDDFRFCLYQMDETERSFLFQLKPAFVLKQFLIWPFQSVFTNLAIELSTYMLFDHFTKVLDFIFIDFILEGYDYSEYLKVFWNISPDNYKDQLRTDDDGIIHPSCYIDEYLEKFCCD